MGQRYVIAAILQSGKLRRVCEKARENKLEADNEAKSLEEQFAPNPVRAFPEAHFSRLEEKEQR
jgi:hypothetical protein